MRDIVKELADCPIFGAHFAEGAEETVKNGVPMYTVELFYANTYNGSNDIEKMRRLTSKGYRVILRIDYRHGQTVPAEGDEEALAGFAERCRTIARDLRGIVDLFVIGNEMDSPHEGAIPARWYARVIGGAKAAGGVYEAMKEANPEAVILAGALSAWPGFPEEAGSRIRWFRTFLDHAGRVDGFALHAYSGWSYWDGSGGIEDPRFSDMTGLLSFREFMKEIYCEYGDSVPVFITETNTYWTLNPKAPSGFSDENYRKGWLVEAYEAIDQWNRSNDLKIHSFCWFTYGTMGIGSPESDIFRNAMERTDNARLNEAREDFGWVTRHLRPVPGLPGEPLRFEAVNYTNSDLWGDSDGIEGIDYYAAGHDAGNSLYRKGKLEIAETGEGGKPALRLKGRGAWARYFSLAGGRSYRLRVRCRAASAEGAVSVVRLRINGTYACEPLRVESAEEDRFLEVQSADSFYLPKQAQDIRFVLVSGDLWLERFELVPVD